MLYHKVRIYLIEFLEVLVLNHWDIAVVEISEELACYSSRQAMHSHLTINHLQALRPSIGQRDKCVKLQQNPPDADPCALQRIQRPCIPAVSIHAQTHCSARSRANPVPGICHHFFQAVRVPCQQKRNLDIDESVLLHTALYQHFCSSEEYVLVWA